MAESASGRRRPWAAALCFVCCHGDDKPRRREHKLRTVPAPVDGLAEHDQAVRRGEDAGGKVSLLRTFCCFLPPANKTRRKETQKKPAERVSLPSNGDDNPPTEAPPAEQLIVAPTTATEIGVAAATIIVPRDDADTSGSSGEALSVAWRAGGWTEAAYFQGEFGPAAGLSVVAAASMAGLLGGRLSAVIACACAWFFALWIRRRRRLAAGTTARGATVWRSL